MKLNRYTRADLESTLMKVGREEEIISKEKLQKKREKKDKERGEESKVTTS